MSLTAQETVIVTTAINAVKKSIKDRITEDSPERDETLYELDDLCSTLTSMDGEEEEEDKPTCVNNCQGCVCK